MTELVEYNIISSCLVCDRIYCDKNTCKQNSLNIEITDLEYLEVNKCSVCKKTKKINKKNHRCKHKICFDCKANSSHFTECKICIDFLKDNNGAKFFTLDKF